MTVSNTLKLKAEFYFSTNIFKPVRNADCVCTFFGNLNLLICFEQVNDG
jgi:hypothetical protein